MKTTDAIEIRYSKLATCSCTLSCGGAINHADPQPGETCLDIGSGRGNDCIRLAERVGATGRVYGLDIAEGMLQKARDNVAEKGITTIELLKSPLEKIPLPENSVDVIISNCTLNHAADKQAVWLEIFRVLTPGGRFVVSDIYSTEVVPQEYATDPVAIAECWAGSIPRDRYMHTIEQCGFSDFNVLEESAPYPKGKISVVSWTIRGYKPLL